MESKSNKNFDVIVIGSGPGGYVAAIQCAQYGLRTAIIEKYDRLGGTCLNVGCIPSKALLHSSAVFHGLIKKSYASHGIACENVQLDFPKMMERQQKVVVTSAKGVQFLMDKHNISSFIGQASFEDERHIRITLSDGSVERIQGSKTVIATGSKAIIPKFLGKKTDRILTSTDLLALKELPESLTVIGAGAIGLEMGSVFARLGTKVKLIESMDSILPVMDSAIGKELLRPLKKLGIKFQLNQKVLEAKSEKESIKLRTQGQGGKELEIESEYCLVAVGRKPNTENLELENISLELTASGTIPVDSSYQTPVPGVFAIGDVIGEPMLAHKASEEAVCMVRNWFDQDIHLNYKAIPYVVYTNPEVAAVGLTESQLETKNIKYKSGTFPFRALGRARASDELDGFVKILAEESSSKILGVHIVGARASDLIAEGVLAVENNLKASDIGLVTHAHPTFSEAFKEACMLASEGKTIHI